MDRRAPGAVGEDAAARALAAAGWTLLERNARVGPLEIDLVLERDGVIGFVEVKARRSRRSGAPEEAVDGTKVRRFAAAAGGYLARRGIPEAPRALLVAAVDLGPDGAPGEVRVLPVEEVPGGAPARRGAR